MADPRRKSSRVSKGSSSVRRKKSGRTRIPDREKAPENNGGRNVEAVDGNIPDISSEIEEISIKSPEEPIPDREKEELTEKCLRLQAEFDNYRKRQAREFRRICSREKRDLIKELLVVLDNFDRAELICGNGKHQYKEVATGLLQTAGQMRDILEREGLNRLDVQSEETFNPHIHEAMQAESVEGLKKDTVIEVLQPGYLYCNELLRPAMVIVGKPGVSAGADVNGEVKVPEGKRKERTSE